MRYASQCSRVMNIFHKHAQRPTPPPFHQAAEPKNCYAIHANEGPAEPVSGCQGRWGGGPLLWPATRCTSWASHYARGPLFGFRHIALTFFNVRLEFFRQRNGLAILKNYSYKCQIPNPQYDVWIIPTVYYARKKKISI